MNATATPTLRRAVQDHRLAAAMVARTAPDAELARLVRSALRRLARHHGPYVAVIERCSGVRLAALFNGGLVAEATPNGRAAMTLAYGKAYSALAVPPGLDTNEFIDALTDRRNPRTEHLSPQPITAEADADQEDRPQI